MKYVVFAVFVVGLSLMTGCMLMIGSPMKKGQENASIGRYQLQSNGQGNMFKIDTVNGNVWREGSEGF